MHHKKQEKIITITLSAAAVYLLLMFLLVAAESGAPGSMQDGERIDSLPKAVWYSLVTLTTVGYGDLYPHTAMGRVIGALFLLLSTGLLALLIGIVVSSISGRILPELILWWNRKKTWYVFTADNDASRALAAHLEDKVVVFCSDLANQSDISNRNHIGISIQKTPRELFSIPFSKGGERFLFAIDEDPLANEKIALELYPCGIQIYCRSDGLDEGLPENVTLFSEFECCARLYWQTRPWKVGGERVVLIGSGQYSRALLIQGMLTAPPDCSLLLFGDWDEWRGMHRELTDNKMLSVGLSFGGRDWYAQPQFLTDADRLILCADDMVDNRKVLLGMRQYFVISGQIDVLSTPTFREAYYFGSAQTLFTPELVMKQALNLRARQLHELYRGKVDYPVPEWKDLSSFLKQSNLAAADHILTKLRLLLPEKEIREVDADACLMAADRYKTLSDEERERFRLIEHERWMLFNLIYNWRYAPVRDNARRRHPLIVPYEKLSEPERRKDDSAWEQLSMLADKS